LLRTILGLGADNYRDQIREYFAYFPYEGALFTLQACRGVPHPDPPDFGAVRDLQVAKETARNDAAVLARDFACIVVPEWSSECSHVREVRACCIPCEHLGEVRAYERVRHSLSEGVVIHVDQGDEGGYLLVQSL
jgi:hypothetical protein